MKNKPACRICKSAIEPFLNFGRMPRGNGFLKAEEFEREFFFDLKVAFCPSCTMVQLIEQPKRELMFNGSYPFFTGSSQRMLLHFKSFAEQALGFLNTPDPFVVEVGSNDGTMLMHFAQRGIRHLGIEPSLNVAQVAQGRGVSTVCEFFDEDLVRRITGVHGKADLILAANVFCHIADIHTVVEGTKALLKPKGLLIFEDPYLAQVIEENAFDQFYDEHAFCFSVSSIRSLFREHGLEVIDVRLQETHGGSMRFFIAHRGTYPVYPSVDVALRREKGLELDQPGTYTRFRQRCEESREKLVSLLCEMRRQGKRIIGYAATSKSSTVINYCGITKDLVEFISDTTPLKQGTFSPGAHIPIRSHEEFLASTPDYALLFAWNHRLEIMEREQEFQRRGGRWILYVPEVKVLP